MNYVRMICVVLIASSGLLKAQAVRGVVIESETGKTIPFATISLPTGEWIAQADTLGRFSVEPFVKKIVCSFPGFEPTTLVLPAPPTTEAKCILNNTVWSVEITTERQKFANTLSMQTLSLREISDAPSLIEADVFRALRMIPGVKQASDFSSGLYIRGGSPDQTLIQLDGATVFNPSHFFGFFSAFNPDALGTVTLYKGGVPAAYGGRMGSVLLLESKETNKSETSASVGLLSTRGSHTGHYKWLNWMIGGRISTLNPVLELLDNVSTDIPEELGFRDVNMRFKVQVSPKTSLHMTHFSSEDALGMSLQNGLELDLWYKNALQVAEIRSIYQTGKMLQLRLSQAKYHGKPAGALNDTGAKRDSRIQESGVELAWLWEQTNASWEAGIKVYASKMTWQDWFAGIFAEIANHSGRQMTTYLQRNRRQLYDWDVQWGIRMTKTSQNRFFAEPRLTLQKKQGRWRHEASYTKLNQWLALVTNESFSGFDTWLLLPKDKKPPVTDQFSIGTQYHAGQKLHFQADAFYRKMNRIFTLDPFLADISNKPYESLLIWGSGEAKGVEMQVASKSRGRLQWNLNYALGQTTRRFEALNDGKPFRPRYDRLHDFTINTTLALKQNWQLGAFFTWASGQPYTKPTGYAQMPNPFGTTFNNVGGTVWFSPSMNNDVLPAYHRLDLNLIKTSISRFGFTKKWIVSMFNAYNHRNIWYFAYTQGQNGAQKTSVRQLPLIPNISFYVHL